MAGGNPNPIQQTSCLHGALDVSTVVEMIRGFYFNLNDIASFQSVQHVSFVNNQSSGVRVKMLLFLVGLFLFFLYLLQLVG